MDPNHSTSTPLNYTQKNYPFDSEFDELCNEFMEDYVMNDPLSQQLELIEQLRRRRQEQKENASLSRRRRPATRKYIDRDREDGARHLFNDYFADNPIFDEETFRVRFCMRKHVFLRIVENLCIHDEYFRQKIDGAGRKGLSPLQKCTTTIRMLAYGTAGDSWDEYLRMGETTILASLSKFVKGIIELFGDEYLRRPNSADVKRLLGLGECRGFPGMMGSIDCMHWEWKNCPTAWKGQFARADHGGAATIVLEAVASEDLWIWHAYFGLPGTCNDINVLDRSLVFDDILQGIAPKVHFTVNGNNYNLGYYLADGIYPEWATFVKSIRLPQTQKEKLFAQHQESVRKDVERAFGVLQTQFKIIQGPARLWSINALGEIMLACIILHNMIVEDMRDTYAQGASFAYLTDEVNHQPPELNHDHIAEYSTIATNRIRIRDKSAHHMLRDDLIEHIWQKFSEN